jgi:hypothetical protein
MASYERLGDLTYNGRLGTFEANRFAGLGGTISKGLTSTAKRIAEVQTITGLLTGRTAKEQRRAQARAEAKTEAGRRRQQQLQDEETEYRRRLAAAKTASERNRIKRELELREQEAAHRQQIELAEIKLMSQQQQQAAASSRAQLRATQSRNTMIAFSVVALVGGLIATVVLSKPH